MQYPLKSLSVHNLPELLLSHIVISIFLRIPCDHPERVSLNLFHLGCVGGMSAA